MSVHLGKCLRGDSTTIYLFQLFSLFCFSIHLHTRQGLSFFTVILMEFHLLVVTMSWALQVNGSSSTILNILFPSYTVIEVRNEIRIGINIISPSFFSQVNRLSTFTIHYDITIRKIIQNYFVMQQPINVFPK